MFFFILSISVGPAKVVVSVPARKSCRFSLRKNLAGSPVPDYGLLRAARMVRAAKLKIQIYEYFRNECVLRTCSTPTRTEPGRSRQSTAPGRTPGTRSATNHPAHDRRIRAAARLPSSDRRPIPGNGQYTQGTLSRRRQSSDDADARRTLPPSRQRRGTGGREDERSVALPARVGRRNIVETHIGRTHSQRTHLVERPQPCSRPRRRRRSARHPLGQLPPPRQPAHPLGISGQGPRTGSRGIRCAVDRYEDLCRDNPSSADLHPHRV